MQNLSLTLLLLCVGCGAWAQSEKTVDSKITSVTVFLNRAQITREASTRVEAGRTTIVFAGLTSQLDQESIQVSGKGNFVILGINHQQNYLNDANPPKPIKLVKDSLETYRKQVVLEQSLKEILTKEEQMILSNQKIGGDNQTLTVAELKAMADFYRTRLSEISVAKMKVDEKIQKVNERIARLSFQLAEQTNLYSRNTSEILVSIEAKSNTAVDLETTYIVSQAGWTPVYDLRAKDVKSPVQLSYKANVFQNTGEEWNNVKLTLSTANPSLGGLKPELYTWNLDFDRPVTLYKARRQANYAAAPSMADAKMEMEEVANAAPAESVAQYTSTIQTTLNTEFNIGLPYTVASNNKPTLVDIQNHEVKALYQYAVTPKLDNDAFLIAKAHGWEEYNLLPGEANVFFEGTFVGKTFIDPNNIKDTLTLSLGRDKRVVVKREKLKDYTSRKLIGANRTDSYAYEITVRNTKNEPVKIVVEDHIPVSQNSQIQVTMNDAGGAAYVKDTGKLSWDFTLKPNEAKKVVYKFEVKYPKDQVIGSLE